MGRPAPLFLARRAYRYRRLLDAARLLPFAGLVLFMVPVLWQPAATPEPDTGRGALYLFPVWALLIVASLVVSRRIIGGASAGSGAPEAGDDGDAPSGVVDPASRPGPSHLPGGR